MGSSLVSLVSPELGSLGMSLGKGVGAKFPFWEFWQFSLWPKTEGQSTATAWKCAEKHSILWSKKRNEEKCEENIEKQRKAKIKKQEKQQKQKQKKYESENQKQKKSAKMQTKCKHDRETRKKEEIHSNPICTNPSKNFPDYGDDLVSRLQIPNSEPRNLTRDFFDVM